MKALTFEPRPEPELTQWTKLLLPTQRAIWELMHRLEGAVHAANAKRGHGTDHFTTALLVSGERGSGKTTVVLSARRATEKPSSFFESADTTYAGEHHRQRGARTASLELSTGRETMMETNAGRIDAERRLLVGSSHGKDRRDREASRPDSEEIEELHLERDLVWLDPLDLEPVPGRSNLLTTLLVRIQGALSGRTKGGRSPGQKVTFIEDGLQDVLGELDGLIRDASLMWEDTAEQSTRERANQRVRAAQIYADFQDRFRKAMGRVAKTLGERQRGEGQTVMVLPVDNVDRSADHVYGIFKLAQIVACPNLWLVLIGDELEMMTLLQRAYRQQLMIEGSAGAASACEDAQQRLIARRQAAATICKVLPVLQRIHIGSVEPEEALEFAMDGETTLAALLKNIKLPSNGGANANGESEVAKGAHHESKVEKDKQPKTLLDLIDITKRVAGVTRIGGLAGAGAQAREGRRILTSAGNDALMLPARTLVDLWQYLSHAVAEAEQSPESARGQAGVYPGKAAVDIARQFLRSSLNEAAIEDAVCKRIQDSIVREKFGVVQVQLAGERSRGHDGEAADGEVEEVKEEEDRIVSETRLELRDTRLQLKATSIRWPGLRRPPACEAVESSLSSSFLQLYKIVDPFLTIAIRDPGSQCWEPAERLPPMVSGWMMLLYDILELARYPWILDDDWIVEGKRLKLVAAKHRFMVQDLGPLEAELDWRVPPFRTFFYADVFREQWLRCAHKLVEWRDSPKRKSPPTGVFERLAAVCWDECADAVMKGVSASLATESPSDAKDHPASVAIDNALASPERNSVERWIHDYAGTPSHGDDGQSDEEDETEGTVRAEWNKGDWLLPFLPESLGAACSSPEKIVESQLGNLWENVTRLWEKRCQKACDWPESKRLQFVWTRFARMRKALFAAAQRQWHSECQSGALRPVSVDQGWRSDEHWAVPIDEEPRSEHLATELARALLSKSGPFGDTSIGARLDVEAVLSPAALRGR